MNQPIHRKDYRAPDYLVGEVEMTIALDESATLVTTRSQFARNPVARDSKPLVLDGGPNVELVSVAIGNRLLETHEYSRENGKLTLGDVGDQATVEIVTHIAPNRNTDFEGLYVSNGTFCTQCEAEGFRRITFYPDRPDVMAKFRVRLEGDKARQPVLLAGGNPVGQGDLPGGRHYAVFDDPFPKPAYLFAVVGGDLDHVEDSFTTMAGRQVALRIFVNKGQAAKAHHAMKAIKDSMAWDERVYGREYQLQVFNVVAVHDFNMGAMENTGLNVFNAKYVLADAETATDTDFANIEGVIAHEYFHNWSGNRVTVRDWFQLSLKEGFTVYRDQEFSADMNNRLVKRIAEVDSLKRRQFVEDAGPTAHPIRPDTFVEIQNFYTPTVYEKGAEVVRMQATMLGPDRFRQATDLYFDRYDGQAVTCEDFVAAMEDASGVDLAQFRLWYEQAGTPVVEASGTYDAAAQTYTLTLAQTVPPTPDRAEKQPMVMPVRLGLLDSRGNDIPLTLEGESTPGKANRVLLLTAAKQEFVFTGVAEQPVVSLFRDFSAPVKVSFPYTADDLRFLMQHDSDGFNRVMAARALASAALKTMLFDSGSDLDPAYVQAVRDNLVRRDLDPALVAEMLALPAKAIFAQDLPVTDIDGLTRLYAKARRQLADALQAELLATYDSNQGARPYDISGAEMSKRSLKNLTLSYLAATGEGAVLDRGRGAVPCCRQHDRPAGGACHHAARRRRPRLDPAGGLPPALPCGPAGDGQMVRRAGRRRSAEPHAGHPEAVRPFRLHAGEPEPGLRPAGICRARVAQLSRCFRGRLCLSWRFGRQARRGQCTSRRPRCRSAAPLEKVRSGAAGTHESRLAGAGRQAGPVEEHGRSRGQELGTNLTYFVTPADGNPDHDRFSNRPGFPPARE